MDPASHSPKRLCSGRVGYRPPPRRWMRASPSWKEVRKSTADTTSVQNLFKFRDSCTPSRLVVRCTFAGELAALECCAASAQHDYARFC